MFRLLGSLLGFGGSVIPGILDSFKKKQDQKYELKKLEVQAQINRENLEHQAKIQKELEGIKKIQKEKPELTTRLKHMILSIDGDYERKTVREFVDTHLLARDARELRNYINKIQPNVDLSFEHEDIRGNITTKSIPVGVNFFWPDATI